MQTEPLDAEPLEAEPLDAEPLDAEPLNAGPLDADTTSPMAEGRSAATLGRYGEQLAVRYLREQGLEIVERNWRCEMGEIDIVALDGRCLVVCEVKTRRSTAFGPPIGQVTAAKLARLRRLAAAWLREHDSHVDDVRIDVIGVLRPRRGPSQLEHLVSVAS